MIVWLFWWLNCVNVQVTTRQLFQSNSRRTVICKPDSRGRRRDRFTVPSQSIFLPMLMCRLFHQSVCSTGASILPLCTRRVVNTSIRGRAALCLFIFRCTRRKKKRKENEKVVHTIFILYIRRFICHFSLALFHHVDAFFFFFASGNASRGFSCSPPLMRGARNSA